jgi:hypothetical protein
MKGFKYTIFSIHHICIHFGFGNSRERDGVDLGCIFWVL